MVSTHDAADATEEAQYRLDSTFEVSVENYLFQVNSHSRTKGSQTLDDAVLAILKNRALRTFADKNSG